MEWLNSAHLVDGLLSHPDIGIKTGIRSFDEATGGLRTGRFYLVSAASGVGKTTLMVSLLTETMIHNPTKRFLYIATEQSVLEIGAKILAHLTCINERKITTNELTEEQVVTLKGVEKSLNNVAFQYYDSASFNLEACLEEALQNGIDYVFYDYLGAIADLDDKKEWRTLETLADRLKRFATKHNICIFTATQCSNDIKTVKEPPEIYDERFIANSKGIARKADVAFIMVRTNEPNQIWLDMYKNRQMESPKRLKYSLNYSTNRLREVLL